MYGVTPKPNTYHNHDEQKELLVSVLIGSMIELLNKKYKIDYFSALQLVLTTKTYKDMYKYDWFRQEGPVYMNSCLEREIGSDARLQSLLNAQ